MEAWLRKWSKSGENNMVGIDDSKPSQLTTNIKETVSKPDLTDHFPILLEGWSESDIHSIGLSYYTLLGSKLGYTAFVDGKIFDRELRRLTDQDTRKSTAPIDDSVWIDQQEFTTVCAVEFQNMSSRTTMRQKVENLVRYDEICESINTLVLHYWDIKQNDLSSYVLSPIVDGFRTNDGAVYEPVDADILLYESVFSSVESGNLILDTVRLAHEY